MRELKNAAARASFAGEGEASPVPAAVTRDSLKAKVRNLERERILAALEASGGRVYGENGVASRLGLKPTTLQSKMKRLGI